MIFGNLEIFKKYLSVNEKFATAFEFIERALREDLPVARYELDGGELYAFIQEYETRTESTWEGHRKYIDIQYIISGVEVMDVSDIGRLTEVIPYDESKDVAFFEDKGDGFTRCTVHSGEYAVFFPEDIHRPGLCLDAPTPVKKIVVKVKI